MNGQPAPNIPVGGARSGRVEGDAALLGIACWIPAIAFMTLIGFATIAYARVGHWPHYSNTDPKDLRLPLLHAADLLSYPIAFVSVPTCLIVLIAAWESLRRRDIVVFTLGAALWAFFLPITGRLFEWLID